MNYKETSISGTSWTRCRAVTIVNPLAGTGERNPMTNELRGPTAHFQEEVVVSLPTGNQIIAGPSCAKSFSADTVITLLDPATGVATGGSMTHAELYRALFSLYMATAAERDAA